ncbi:hypothetical protein NADFUDRAFT_83686 [Nadsonia fulvescens var. elongata DSM 6958]|uniref:Hap4 transcription factor heteromerisation domain-containing protein n=1 Tax=Nadsonia fulvescens var. elongata DSM 6958 TaxID=857566 RepID=A0A1E3PHE0_9ASCO|nr:hypothetical protein NADFUDRAFT_83686 [Nadsonia fulvescens var. elongata DSM 6958]
MISTQSVKSELERTLELSPQLVYAFIQGGEGATLSGSSASLTTTTSTAAITTDKTIAVDIAADETVADTIRSSLHDQNFSNSSSSRISTPSSSYNSSSSLSISPPSKAPCRTTATLVANPQTYHPGKLLESNSSHPIINHISVSKKWVLPPRPRPGRKPSSASTSSQNESCPHSSERPTNIHPSDLPGSHSISPSHNISKPPISSRRKSKSAAPLANNPDLITARVLQLEEKIESVLKCNKEQELSLCTRLTYANNEIQRLNSIVSGLKALVRRTSSCANSPLNNATVSTDLLLAELSGDYALNDNTFTPTPPLHGSPFDSYSISSLDSYEQQILNGEIRYSSYQDPLDEFIHDPSSADDEEKVEPADMNMTTFDLNI